MNKAIIGFAGEIASGKDTAVSYLKEKHGALTFKFSACLRDILDRMYLGQTRENMQTLSTILRKNYSQDLFSKVIAKDVQASDKELIVIGGVRRQTDIEHLKNIPGFKLAYIDADEKIRYERLIKRSENPDDQTKTFEQFQKEAQAETENQIRDLKDIADVVIDNNGSLEDLYKQLDKLLNQ
jgi:dephospho-CoA kinase